MKRIFAYITVCAVIFMVFSPVAYAMDDIVPVAENLEDGTTKEVKVYNLSLEEAIEMAYTDNPQIIANEYKQAATKINIKSARMDKNTLKDTQKAMANANIPGVSGISVSTLETLLVRDGYLVKAAEVQNTLAIKEADKIKSSISYKVLEAYYNLILTDKLVNAAENAYSLALENKKAVDSQYALGLIPQIDYENAEISVLSAKNAVDSYVLSREIAMENLKIQLNKKDENCIIVPTDEIECTEFTSDLDADIKAALNTRYDITALKEQRNLAEAYFNTAKAFTESSASYNTAYADFVSADYTYTSTVDLIGLSIRSSYNAILTSASSMDISRRQYEMKLKEYQSGKLKYDLGMISNIELTAAINDLYNAQVAYANAKLGYRLAVEKYKYEITTGL